MCDTRLYPVTSGVESEVWSGVAEKRDSWSELRMLGRRPGTAGPFTFDFDLGRRGYYPLIGFGREDEERSTLVAFQLPATRSHLESSYVICSPCHFLQHKFHSSPLRSTVTTGCVKAGRSKSYSLVAETCMWTNHTNRPQSGLGFRSPHEAFCQETF
ncbi:hypothetical protein BDV93DRAFT_66787 [Ceratobasidium sp. AG-I]|nr:hypothetical protein BDV93DRAFT_66787 [Ceratobasidium sp. AG-I]